MHNVAMSRLALLALLTLLAASCGGPTAPLDKVVRVDDIVTGWFDAGVTDDGKNKIVPSLSFKLTNTSNEPTGAIQLNCIFRRVGDPAEWSTTVVRAVDANGLAASATSPPVVVRAPQGYTGVQPRAQLLDNKLFIDAKVEVFGKHGSATWVKLGEFRIARQLLTR